MNSAGMRLDRGGYHFEIPSKKVVVTTFQGTTLGVFGYDISDAQIGTSVSDKVAVLKISTSKLNPLGQQFIFVLSRTRC
jgi:hypothetical protein